jgi:2,4-dienoyl-CoA reductase-like NADH-dependent reductase (Old Yellow Enzyme family)
MSDNPHYPRLFTPVKVGGRTLRNRVVLSATLTNFGAGHRITERWSNFLVERARGGCGAIITEVIAVDPAALSHGAIVTGYDETNEEGFRRTAEAVEGAGACIIGQLWHPGRQQLWSPVWSPKGISDQPDAYSWTVPHVMTTDELRQVADEYIAVARRLARCGFGGVELHGAHGYLISQILSPWSNRRSDAYCSPRAPRSPATSTTAAPSASTADSITQGPISSSRPSLCRFRMACSRGGMSSPGVCVRF